MCRKSLSHELIFRVQESYRTIDGKGQEIGVLEAYRKYLEKADSTLSEPGEGGIVASTCIREDREERPKQRSGLSVFGGFPAGTGEQPQSRFSNVL